MPRGVYERKPRRKATDMADETITPAEPSEPTEQPELTVPAVGSKKKTPDGALCVSCWPAGWPQSGDAAECVHGTWTR